MLNKFFWVKGICLLTAKTSGLRPVFSLSHFFIIFQNCCLLKRVDIYDEPTFHACPPFLANSTLFCILELPLSLLGLMVWVELTPLLAPDVDISPRPGQRKCHLVFRFRWEKLIRNYLAWFAGVNRGQECAFAARKIQALGCQWKNCFLKM